MSKEIEKLNKEIQRLKKELKKKKKYGLVWEDKPEEVVEMCKEKLPVLKEVKDKEIITDKEKPVNLLIEGDNYHALSVLNYTHKGKIDVIYIDPPYNTGNKDFKYNDRFVDKEDSYRHSKWLTFMSKRLWLAKNLLADEGVMFISIDDNELAQLKLICDDIFGENNVELMIWRKVGEGDAGAGRMKITYRFRVEHEYIIVCYVNKDIAHFNKTLEIPNFKNEYKNPDKDPRGPYKAGNMSKSEDLSNESGKNYYSVKSPTGKTFARQWHFDKEIFDRLNKDKRIYWGKRGDAVPSIKIFVNELRPTTPISLLLEKGSATSANKFLEDMFSGRVFDNPKPVELIRYLLEISTGKEATVLDFFAGTGTTGHAILDLNGDPGSYRKFIICTNDDELDHNGGEKKHKICSDVCYPRIKKIIEGYKNSKGEKVVGLGGNLKYFKTDFVDYNLPTDKNKIKLTEEAIEMLCVKEGTFELVQGGKDFKIFKNSDHYTGIIFDQSTISAFKKAIVDIKVKLSVYVFSLGDDDFSDEFSDLKQKVVISPIPEAILKVYRRIFK